ncbi:hypothetical protein HY463_01545 [Candidatus Peregrinibacteria bacterium]|nr:hypothetical protein [Candidatus Peregrinibacteria bacterium]
MENDRLDRLIEEAILEKQIAGYQYTPGSREDERTTGALAALERCSKVLEADIDETAQETTGFVMRNVTIPSLMGFELNWLKITGPKYLCIGEVEKIRAFENSTYSPMRPEILRVIKGTRKEILKNFLREVQDDNDAKLIGV